jgi:hypothetical protein
VAIRNQSESLPAFYLAAASRDRRAPFVAYCKQAVKDVEAGRRKMKDVAYNICGAIQFDEIQEDPELDPIVDLACQLEMPTEHQGGSAAEAQNWSDLVALVRQLDH